MSVSRIARSLQAAAALSVVLGAGNASAIEIFMLDGTGAVIGGPLPVAWSIYGTSPVGGTTLSDNSGGAATDWEIGVGVPNFGSAEADTQTSAIYGASTILAPASGYRAVFKFDGFTWDSYNTTVPTNPGASSGYWDLFGVNINQVGEYPTLVDGGSGGITDPVVTPDPAGAPVVSGAPLPGITWAWGGLDYAAGFFEELHGVFTLDLLGAPGTPYVISVFLDTATTPNSDSGFPSWGAFNADGGVTPPEGGESQNVPEPGALALLGLGLAGIGWMRRRNAR